MQSSPLRLAFFPVARIRFASSPSTPSFPPGAVATCFTLADDATDSLANLTLAPEDEGNGLDWALDVFRQLPEPQRATFIDQVAMLTPLSMWNRLDPILNQPSWGSEVQDRLFHRLLELPLPMQLPRLIRLAMNPSHPSSSRANTLLQSYFPEIVAWDYPAYLRRIPQS
ncbi:MAG: hypothetical protein EBZ78_09445 [Verrucomicrobia bacterium]|nr:hypothetical protein [Verrucomicrobiota bacterium]